MCNKTVISLSLFKRFQRKINIKDLIYFMIVILVLFDLVMFLTLIFLFIYFLICPTHTLLELIVFKFCVNVRHFQFFEGKMESFVGFRRRFIERE